jgi:uncharacterized protein YndB with AHSA1/START domain
MTKTLLTLIAPAIVLLGLPCHSQTKQKQSTELKTANKMTTQDFTTSILVDQSPEQVFEAVNNVRGWWSEEIEGSTDMLNAEFRYHFKDLHRSKMKIIEMVPAKKVVWFVEDNYFNFTKDKSEWIGTKIIFEISRKGNKTRLNFTHEGLVPAYECYNVCHDAWTEYIENSLRNLITTGKGQPNPKDGVNSINADNIKKWDLKEE